MSLREKRILISSTEFLSYSSCSHWKCCAFPPLKTQSQKIWKLFACFILPGESIGIIKFHNQQRGERTNNCKEEKLKSSPSRLAFFSLTFTYLHTLKGDWDFVPWFLKLIEKVFIDHHRWVGGFCTVKKGKFNQTSTFKLQHSLCWFYTSQTKWLINILRLRTLLKGKGSLKTGDAEHFKKSQLTHWSPSNKLCKSIKYFRKEKLWKQQNHQQLIETK